MSAMIKRKVKFYNGQFGFITPHDETKNDVFFHYSDLEKVGLRELNKNQEVRFDIVTSRDGRPKAGHIELVV
jgi:cold shock CspA family protein